MLVSRVLSRISRTAGARSLLLIAPKKIQTPSFATQFHFPIKLGGSSPYPVFMLHAALCSSSGLPKPNLENTTDNQSTRRDNVEQIKLSMKEEIQQLEQKMLELKALPKPDMEKTTDNQSARREEDVERFKSQNEDVNQQLKLNSENAEKLNGKSDSIFSRISALIVGVVCALIYSQFIISKR